MGRLGLFYNMKFLFFKDVSKDYKAEMDKVKVGSLWMGVGMYEDADAKKILKAHKDLVSEIDQAQYESLKKKEAVTERVFKTQQQDPSKDPNAVYAEKSKSPTSPSKSAKDLVSVGKAVVEKAIDD